MTTREMFSLWWEKRWIRLIVISLSPIGLIDAIYTLMLFNIYGLDFEANPLVRIALSTDWWIVWFFLDVFAFSLFAMITGSYYIHTRSPIFSNKIWWFAALIGFRVMAACYNILFYYAIEPPFIIALLVGIFATYISGMLLTRTEDVTKETFSDLIRRKTSEFRHWYLTRGVKIKDEYSTHPVPEVKSEEMPAPAARGSVILLLKRAGYVSGILLVFVSTPFLLVFIAEITGALTWSSEYGPIVFWNEISGTAFVVGFGVIIILTAAMMYFILKAFNSTGEPW